MSLYTTLLYFITGTLLSIVGGVIIFQNKKLPSDWSLLFFVISVVLYIVSIYLGYYFVNPGFPELSTFFIRIAFLFGLFMTLSLCAFSYYYPKKTFTYSLYIQYGFLVATITMGIIATFTPLVYKKEIITEGILVADIHGPLHNLFIFHYLLNSFAATWIAVKKIFQTHGIDRNKTILSLIGILSVVFPIIIFHTILPKFGIYLLQTEVVLFSLIFVALIFYSMHKYRFFNLSSLILNFSRKLILLFFFIVISLIFHKIFNFFILDRNEIVVDIMSYGLGALLLQQIRKIFPEFISSNLRDLQNILKEVRVRLYSCEEYSQLQKILEDAFVLHLHVSQARVFLLRDKEEDISIPIYKKDEFSEEFYKFKNDVLVFEEIGLRGIGNEKNYIFQKIMKKLGASLCFPLFSEDKLIGFFMLGNKENNDLYTKEEIDEILTVIHNIEVVFMNILLKKNLQEENNFMKVVIQEKTQQLREKMKELRSLLKQQSDFIAIASHEFRTPLSVALFQLEDTKESHQHSEHVLEELEVITQSLGNLKGLTQKLFDVQQFDLKKIQFNPLAVKIQPFFQRIFHEFQPLMMQKSIQFELENIFSKKIQCLIDENLIKQVIGNILTNAYKFTPEQGRIRMVVGEMTEKTKKYVLVSLSDSGTGIPHDQKRKVFSKFRTGNHTKNVGIGLGLYICKQIMDLHKGKIWIEDSDFGGTKLCLLFEQT